MAHQKRPSRTAHSPLSLIPFRSYLFSPSTPSLHTAQTFVGRGRDGISCFCCRTACIISTYTMYTFFLAVVCCCCVLQRFLRVLAFIRNEHFGRSLATWDFRHRWRCSPCTFSSSLGSAGRSPHIKTALSSTRCARRAVR